jgi:Domain of unknown function (DUF6265)
MNTPSLLRAATAIGLAALHAAAPAQAVELSRLQWLAGCWASATGEAGSGEVWMAPAGGSMLGVSRTVKGSKTVAHEFMQIRELADGRLAYIAEPSGQRRTEFPLKGLTDTEAVFENPTHDFPQRVAYKLESPDALRARIEGQRNGRERVIEFPMRRTPCP